MAVVVDIDVISIWADASLCLRIEYPWRGATYAFLCYIVPVSRTEAGDASPSPVDIWRCFGADT